MMINYRHAKQMFAWFCLCFALTGFGLDTAHAQNFMLPKGCKTATGDGQENETDLYQPEVTTYYISGDRAYVLDVISVDSVSDPQSGNPPYWTTTVNMGPLLQAKASFIAFNVAYTPLLNFYSTEHVSSSNPVQQWILPSTQYVSPLNHIVPTTQIQVVNKSYAPIAKSVVEFHPAVVGVNAVQQRSLTLVADENGRVEVDCMLFHLNEISVSVYSDAGDHLFDTVVTNPMSNIYQIIDPSAGEN